MRLIIGDYNYSTWSMRPWLFVHKYSLPVEIKRYALDTRETHQVLLRNFSNGKVPILLDQTTEVWDSLAILEYLGEKFPQTCPWPSNLQARAVARSVSAEMHSSFTAMRSEAPMNIKRRFPGYMLSEAATADVKRIQSIWSYCTERYADGGPWLFGRFTIADAMFVPVVMRFRSVNVELDDNALQYCETVNNDTSVREWIRQAMSESHRVEADELDWPSQPIGKT